MYLFIFLVQFSIDGNVNKRVDAVGRMGKSCLFFLSLLSFYNESLESIHSKIGDVVNVKSYGSSMIPISVDGPWKDA
jgi:hypothetical protein